MINLAHLADRVGHQIFVAHIDQPARRHQLAVLLEALVHPHERIEHVAFDPAGSPLVAASLALRSATSTAELSTEKHERIADDVHELRVGKDFQDRAHTGRVRGRLQHDPTIAHQCHTLHKLSHVRFQASRSAVGNDRRSRYSSATGP